MTNPTDGIIIHREPVTLKKAARATVVRLYDEAVVTKTIVEKITYLSDGLQVKGYLARPVQVGHYPVLIWNRGGSGDRGALNDMTAYLILASTAVWGYVVLGTQYRGNRGSEGEEDWGGEDVNDTLNLLEVANNIPEADPELCAIEGASRGGLTTYRALSMNHSFKCAIVHAGITDVVRLCEQKSDFKKYLKKLFGHLCDDDRQEELHRRSAVRFAEQLPKDVPLLIMHGDSDEVVPLEQSQLLVARLKKLHIPHKFIILEGGTHVALKDGTYREIDRYRRAWLKKYLKKT
ncbi:MAG: alpha/beta hydrolase family protein [Candidatus Zixiibacteriota bacterium]